MNKRFVQFFCITVFLAVAFFYSANWFVNESSEETPELTWSTLLKELNRKGDDASDLIFPFSHEANVDLLKQNEDELALIKKRWQESKPSLASASELRKAENQFFHEAVNSLNEKTFSALEKASESHKNLKKDYRSLAAEVLSKAHSNPVASLSNVYNYEYGGQIGFCFGRALLIHYYLLKAGVDQNDIAKIFTVGDLRVEKQFWKFHVAVLLRDSENGFLVVDPLHEKPLEYKEWLKINSLYDIKAPLSRARFYVTDPRKFLPSFGFYDRDQVSNPVLKNYFDDLIRSL